MPLIYFPQRACFCTVARIDFLCGVCFDYVSVARLDEFALGVGETIARIYFHAYFFSPLYAISLKLFRSPILFFFRLSLSRCHIGDTCMSTYLLTSTSSQRTTRFTCYLICRYAFFGAIYFVILFLQKAFPLSRYCFLLPGFFRRTSTVPFLPVAGFELGSPSQIRLLLSSTRIRLLLCGCLRPSNEACITPRFRFAKAHKKVK